MISQIEDFLLHQSIFSLAITKVEKATCMTFSFCFLFAVLDAFAGDTSSSCGHLNFRILSLSSKVLSMYTCLWNSLYEADASEKMFNNLPETSGSEATWVTIFFNFTPSSVIWKGLPRGYMKLNNFSMFSFIILIFDLERWWLRTASECVSDERVRDRIKLEMSRISWYISCHSVTNSISPVWPMIPLEHFWDLLIVCSYFISAAIALKFPDVVLTTKLPRRNCLYIHVIVYTVHFLKDRQKSTHSFCAKQKISHTISFNQIFLSS